MSEPLARPIRRRNGVHGWMATTVESRLGSFKFRNGYPTAEAVVDLLRDALFLGRAIDVYLAQMPAVSWFHVWKGVARQGSGLPNQLVIWESLMDAQTLLLTGNCW